MTKKKGKGSHISISGLRASMLILEQTEKILGNVSNETRHDVHLHYEHFKQAHVPEKILNAYQFTSQAIIKGFLIEISLKYLYILKYCKERIKDDYIEREGLPWGHDIYQLLIDVQEKDFVLALLDSQIQNKTREQIEQVIRDNSENFENWRYNFEENAKPNEDGGLIPNPDKKLVFSNTVLQPLYNIIKSLIESKDVYPKKK